MKKKIFIFLIIIFWAVGFVVVKEAKAGASDNVWGWAWSENIGWISFNSTTGGGGVNYGVHICESETDPLCSTVSAPKTGKFTGYAWSENIGWITFNSADLAGCPSAPCEARIDLVTAEVSGWARAYRAIDPEGQTLGGWDGWIKLRGTWTNPVFLDTSVNPAEFTGWAWGSDVVGWISFNRTNCDPDKNGQSNGIGNCPPVGTAISNYKVMTDLSINQTPDQPTNLNESWGYCGGIPSVNTRTTLTLNWSAFSDLDSGDTQQAYEVEIAGNSHVASQVGSSYSVDPPNHGVSSFDWGNSYNWRVRVQDKNGSSWSEWSAYDSFTMPNHQAPNPSFTANPANPPAGVPVIFDETSKCYNVAGVVEVEYDCAEEPNLYGIVVIYAWDFDDNGTTDDTTKGDTAYTYTARGNYTARLSVTDDMGTCSATQPIGVKLPLPRWREIAPVF